MKNTEQLEFERVNAMPAPTWNFLKMNDAGIDLPEGLAIVSNVTSNVPLSARGPVDEFENAMADAQDAWERSHPEPTPEELAERAQYQAAEADATYGGTAQSAYQMSAEALEEARSLSLAFDHGVGEEAAAYLRYAARDRIVVEADAGRDVSAQVALASAPGTLSAAAVDVIANPGSRVELSLVVDSPDQEPTGQTAYTGTTVRVFADSGSRVMVKRVQTLSQDVVDIDDMGLFAGEDARIEVHQVVLGGKASYTGLAGDLRGDQSRVDVDTRYLGCGEQSRDFNYSLRHHGRKTVCNLAANGVLADKSSKTLRGTIDLVRGCKGAEGSETETVLLVDEDVHNKTIPVILCSEDDVAGNHGATIGHIRDEQLFYLQCRGLSQGDAERMFVSAAVERAALDASDDVARQGIVRLGEHLNPGFARLFEEE